MFVKQWGLLDHFSNIRGLVYCFPFFFLSFLLVIGFYKFCMEKEGKKALPNNELKQY